MESVFDLKSAKALLEWHAELGISEAISERPINRFESKIEANLGPKTSEPKDIHVKIISDNPTDQEVMETANAKNLSELKAAIENFPHCDLKYGARNAVFSAGSPSAKIMIIGEAPGREEDFQGEPFVGRAGQLLDKMLFSIGLSREARDAEKAVYITNVMPWRPPENREPTQDEIDMMVPFLKRHIELVNPNVLVAMGNISCQSLIGRRGITKIRGIWAEAFGLPVLPMLHPAYLLRNPVAKREAWFDLLSLREKVFT